MSLVSYQEKAFLHLVGRRLLQHRRAAEASGEKYHESANYAPLQCGVRARFFFEDSPGGYIQVVQIRGANTFKPEEYEEIASYILDAPAKLRTQLGNDLEYVRKVDAGIEAPG